MARSERLEGKTLSSTETLEGNLQPEPAEGVAGQEPVGHDHDHDHDHSHEGHQHGPVLNPDCTRELVLDVPADEVAKAFRSVTANYKKYARIPGFRPGKTPDSVIRRRFGSDIRKEVVDTLLPERFNQAVREQGV